MGGLLFGTSRLPLVEFNKYRANIESILKFYDIQYQIPLYYRSKEDFGDLDIIIKNTVPVSTLLKIFKDCECHYDRSEVTVSFNYKDFQIDFIRVNPSDYESSFEYFSYNDLGNLIGQLAKFNHCKYGNDGLRHDHYIKGQKKGTISISKDIDKILRFLDLDPVRYHKGFDTMEEVFDFIVTSKYFNPYVSDLEPYGYDEKGVALYRLNKVNRERNEKRRTYQLWLEYVKKFKTGEENYMFREDTDVEAAYDRIDKFFPECHFKERVQEIENEEVKKNEIKKKFNGGIVIALLPDLPKEDRQFFIDSFKSSKKNFNDYIINSSQDTINDDILSFYQSFKDKYGE